MAERRQNETEQLHIMFYNHRTSDYFEDKIVNRESFEDKEAPFVASRPIRPTSRISKVKF